MALQISKALGGQEMCAAEIEPSLARGIESPVQRAGPHSWKLDKQPLQPGGGKASRLEGPQATETVQQELTVSLGFLLLKSLEICTPSKPTDL